MQHYYLAFFYYFLILCCIWQCTLSKFSERSSDSLRHIDHGSAVTQCSWRVKLEKKYIALRFLKFLFKSRLQTVYSSYKRLSYSLLTYYIKYEHFFKNIDKVVLGTIHKKPECKPNFVDYSSQIIKTHIFIVLTHS